MFLVLVGIVFLYIDNRMVYKEQIEAQKSRITKLEGEVQKLQEDIVKLAKECD
jgi:polyhydroxyalkanoate synthesis regulator phasin